MSSEVVIYSSDYCPFCVRAKHLLASKGIDYREVVVDGNRALREEMQLLSGRHTVPQIWIGETHVGGCDELYELESLGELDQMIAAIS